MLPFRLLVVTDAGAAHAAGRGVVETLARALLPEAAGAAVLVRMKGASVDEVAAACSAVRALARRAGALVLVHTHAPLVARLGLDGVHLDAQARVDEARIALPPGALLGASRHAGDGVGRFFGLDYATMSPVFRPSSKRDDVRPPLGVAGLAAAAATARVPLVALGGVDDTNARACLSAGAKAVAVLGAVMAAHDPRRALTALLR